MSKYEVILHAVVVQGLSLGAAAKRFNVSKTLVHKLHKRFLLEGRMDLEPRSRAPRRVPRKISPEVREQIQQLRRQLTTDGFDAGADTVVELPHREGITVSRTSVWRILHEQQLITAQPQKKPLTALSRFVADQPNELWQSDTTHWQLANGREIEIIGWLDDHSRFLTHLSAHPVATGKTVTESFLLAAKSHGFPTATLTDNGLIFTTRFAGGTNRRTSPNAFETLLALHGITQKNGKPYKPTTQGKIERFWRTLKTFLDANPVNSLDTLNTELQRFQHHYNHIRPHRSLGRKTPSFAYTLIPKAQPTPPDHPDLWRVRYDIVDEGGKVSLRYGNLMMHLGIGRAHHRTPVIVLVHGLDATTITHTGEVLAEHRINPKKIYQPKR